MRIEDAISYFCNSHCISEPVDKKEKIDILRRMYNIGMLTKNEYENCKRNAGEKYSRND